MNCELLHCLLADPIFTPLLIAAGLSATAAAIGAAVITAALAVGVSYAANKYLAPEGETAAATAGGVELDLRADSHVVQSILFGKAVTAGSLVYAETYGETTSTKNSDLIQIIAIADTPVDSLDDIFIDGRRVTLDVNGDVPAFGSTPSLVNIKFYTGSQTVVDNLASVKLGGHAQRGWASTAVGFGRCYARVHFRYDPKRVTGPLGLKFVVKGMALYDPRKDTTVGGSGSQTFGNLNSHTWTDNLAVIAYNILRGVRVKNSDASITTIFGVDDTPASALPLSNWFAAMNACDNVGGLLGGTMKGGAEIAVDTPPLDAITAILKSCNGRLTECGGIYKLFIDNPGAAVATITDADILSTSDETFDPIAPLVQKINHITGSYTRAGQWVTTVAPPRVNATSLAASGRKVSADLNAPWVQAGNQMQRLMKMMLAEAGRERHHTIPLSRAFFALEPQDVIAWTSTRNGYSAKLFRIDTIAKSANLSCVLGITELDPTDYSWSPGDEITEDDIDVDPVPFPAKTIIGLIAAAIDVKGDTTTRAAIQLTFTDPQDLDIVGMEAQYRVSPTGTILTSSSAEIADLEMTIISGIQHQTTYDVRARFISYEGAECAWSSWLTLAVGDVNVGGAITITTYLFDTNVTAADPGGGKLRLNATTWAAATKIFVDDLASAGPDYSAFFLKMVAGDTVRVQVGADATRFAKYILTSPPVDHVGWFEFNVSPLLIGTGAMPSNGNSLAVTWAYGTAAGSGGPPPINSVGPNELQDNAVTNPKIADDAVDTLELKNLAITAPKVKTVREFSGQFAKDATFNGPPKGGSSFTLVNNVQVDGRTTEVWCVARMEGIIKLTKASNKFYKLSAEIRAGTRVIATGTTRISAVIKNAPWNITIVGQVALPQGTYDLTLVIVNSAIGPGTGFTFNMIGQAPRA
jgi:hypothetical protein